jgi:thiol-disulfide isomerase/thioredoxin
MHRNLSALLALAALFFCGTVQAGIQPGETPPDSLGKTREGHEVSLATQRGKVVVISFWATWCGYCMQEMPVLANLQAIASDRHLPLQVISIDSREDRQTFVHSARALQPRLPGLMLSWDPDGKIGEPYGADKAIPVMVMLHRDGTVAHVHVGYGADMLDSLVGEINGLLAEPDLAPPVAGSKG